MVDKKIKVMRELVEPHRYCDICGKEININFTYHTAKCIYCGRDLCEKHVGYVEDTSGDYRIVYCKNCWNLGKPYRPRIEELENEITFLYKKWQDECKKDDIKELI